MNPREKYSIPSLRNACRTLRHVARHSGGIDLGSISRDLAIPRTTALRICTTLESENLLARDRNGAYVLGAGLAPLGMQAMPNARIREMAVPALRSIVDRIGETAHLAIPCGKSSLILEVCDSPHPLRVASRPGSLAHIHCSATGKIFLAFSVFVPLEKFLRDVDLPAMTPSTLVSVAQLAPEIERVRKLGYAMDNEEYFIGVRCLAAPVRDHRGHVVAAAGITGAASRFTPDKVEPFAAIIGEAAADLTRKLVASGLAPEQPRIDVRPSIDPDSVGEGMLP